MREEGTIVIIAVISAMILMAISAYFLNSLVVEMKITESIDGGQKSYYLAESGINEAIWRLKNDEEWSQNFTDPALNPDSDGDYWSASFEGSEVGEGSYSVQIQNTAPGEAVISATAQSPFFSQHAKREAEVTVFKALDSPTDDSAIFSGGSGSNVRISHSKLSIDGGNIFSNHNLGIQGNSTVALYDNLETEKLEGQALSTQNITLDSSSTLEEYTAICSKNNCTEECNECPAKEKSIPIVDFDSSEDSSFKSRAINQEDQGNCSIVCDPDDESAYECSNKCYLKEKEFEDLLWSVGQDGSLILNNDITYVTGEVDVKGGRELIVDGSLVAEKSIFIGTREDWVREGNKHSGYNYLEINNPNKDKPSGVLTKQKIYFGSYSLNKDSLIEGVIYAGDQIRMVSLPYKLDVVGGIMARKLTFITLSEGLNITLNNDIILQGLGYVIDGEAVNPSFSPIIEVEHWEEVY